MDLRQQIIEAMCREYRSDYAVTKLESDPSWVQGMTAAEQQALRQTMTALYDEHLAKLIAKKHK